MIIVMYELFLINSKYQHRHHHNQQQVHHQHQLIFKFEHKIIKEIKFKYVFTYLNFIGKNINKIILFQAAALATLEVRSQLPPSPKSQPQQQPRPPSTTPRTPSITQPPAEFLIQSQTKSLTSSTVYIIK